MQERRLEGYIGGFDVYCFRYNNVRILQYEQFNSCELDKDFNRVGALHLHCLTHSLHCRFSTYLISSSLLSIPHFMRPRFRLKILGVTIFLTTDQVLSNYLQPHIGAGISAA